jgi:dCMP deaminase
MEDFDPNKWHRRYLSLAREISTWSKDPSRRIGAVAVSENGRILATGYNGFPRAIRDFPYLYESRELKYERVVHAEMNCIYNATYNGVCLDGSTLYVWGLPTCRECAKGVLQVGIRAVYWGTDTEIPEQWESSLRDTTDLFKEASLRSDVRIDRLHLD